LPNLVFFHIDNSPKARVTPIEASTKLVFRAGNFSRRIADAMYILTSEIAVL